MEYSPSIEKLIESFEKLPSIGHKTAQRLAFYMLDQSKEEIKEFTDSIINAKNNLKFCSKCFNISDTDPCNICSNSKRDESVICVVEDVKDVLAMERTHEFNRSLPCSSWLNFTNEWNWSRRYKNKRIAFKTYGRNS